MNEIRHKLLVMSGKGGVGKTTVAVNLAYALAQTGARVGLLDVDIHGPNVPKMLGIEDEKCMADDKGIKPVAYSDNLFVISIAFLMDKENAAIWRGPMKHNVINQFLNDVDWGKLDYLVIDFPPGTGDEAISVSQLLKDINGSIIVSTPQEVALLDAVKAVDFSRKVNVPVAGIVENMSGEIFGKGGAEEAAKKAGVRFLGRIDMDARIRQSGDKGKPITASEPKVFKQIADNIMKICQEKGPGEDQEKDKK